MFIKSSHMLAIPSTLAPLPVAAWRDAGSSRREHQPGGCGYSVRGPSKGRCLPARPPRVLRLGHQLQSWRLPCRTTTQATSCRAPYNQSKMYSARGFKYSWGFRTVSPPLHAFFTTILCGHDKLHLDPQGMSSRLSNAG